MNTISRRTPPHWGVLVLGVICGALCAYALATGKFLLAPGRRGSSRQAYVIQGEDPLLFLFWVRVTAIYFAGLCGLAFFRVEAVEARLGARRPWFGRRPIVRGVTAASESSGIAGLATFFAVAILGICYAATLA